MAGFDVGGSVSAETFSRPEPILGHLSLRGEIPFPGRTIIGSEGLALVPDLARRPRAVMAEGANSVDEVLAM
jgi:hypothetical protein